MVNTDVVAWRRTLKWFGWVVLGFGLLVVFGLQAPVPVAQAQTLSLDSLVRADGTPDLTTGTSGTFDLKGWSVALDPKRGPIFSPKNAAPRAGEAWTGLGPGLNNDVNIVAFHGSDVFVGGAFKGLCNDLVCGNPTNMNNIARWDGSAWHSLEFGVNDQVYGLYVDGNDLYVSGYFTQKCGNAACNGSNTTLNHIARWDGAWHSLQNGLSRNPYVIVKHGTDFYVGGYFAEYCGNSACNSNTIVNHIARWDGTNWNKVGNGVSLGSGSPAVTALVFNGNDMYIGGGFAAICGNDTCDNNNTTVSNTAMWDGSTWHTLGFGLDNTVYQIGIIGSDVYAGGDFGNLCGNATCDNNNTRTNYIARWDGSQWNTVGNGLDGSVYDLTVNGNDVYVGGGFTHVCGVSTCDSGNTIANHVARWDGSWHTMANGVNGNVYTIRLNRNDPSASSGLGLYIGGSFGLVCGNAACDTGNTTVNRIAKLTFNPTQTGPTFVVNTDADTDDGLCDTAGQGFGNKDCTLREAINAANAQGGANTILFDTSRSISLSTATLPTLTGDTTIDGGTNAVDISGAGAYRIFTVESAITLNVNHLALHNGKGDPSLTFGHSGGAIYDEGGTLNVSNSAFVSNSAGNYGGAIYTNGPTTISNSTFYQNNATDVGGGVTVNDGTILNSTFSDNVSGSGGGVYAGGTLTLKNTILTNSTGGDCVANAVSNSINNLIDDANSACGLVNGTDGNVIGIPAFLGLLDYHGGVTPNFDLRAISPAVDGGDDTTCATAPVSALDQRGIGRPFDAHCDMGAFEKTTADCGSETPEFARLLTPTMGKTLNKTKVAFDWTDSVCATSYKITVRNTTTHTKVTKTVTNSKVKLTLPHGKEKWWVRACNETGCVTSEKFKFTN